MDPEKNVDPGNDETFSEDCIPVFFVAAVYIGFFLLTFLGVSNSRPQIQVNSLSVNNFSVSVSETKLSGDWNIILSIKNPYKGYIISYSSFEVHVSYRKEFISGGMIISCFEQAAGEENLLAAGFNHSSATISRPSAHEVEEELVGSGAVEFDVTIHGKIKTFADERSRSRAMHYKISGSCENLKVGFDTSHTVGTMLKRQTPSFCKVRSRS